MSDCVHDGNGACVKCGWKWELHPEPWPSRNCGGSHDLAPVASRLGVSLNDVGHYAHALIRWAAAGFPVRDQAEVERIEQECCRPCEDYLNGRCKECGCRVNQSGLAVANKIKMANERCPKETW